MSEETALASLASEVEDAREALLAAARDATKEDPEGSFAIGYLVSRVKGEWRDAVVMIALERLLKDHELVADSRWRVRLSG